MCYKVSWIITNGIEWKSIHSFLSVFLMHRNIKKFAKICTEKFLFCRKRKKTLQSKPRERSFTMTKKWRLKLKFVVDRWRMKKLISSPCLLAFSTVQNASYPGFLDMKARDEEALSLLQAFDIIWELGLS